MITLDVSLFTCAGPSPPQPRWGVASEMKCRGSRPAIVPLSPSNSSPAVWSIIVFKIILHVLLMEKVPYFMNNSLPEKFIL